MAAGSVKAKGLREFQRALKTADPVLKKQVREAFKESGEIVRAEGASRFSDIDTRSAAGFKTRVRQRGVSVEQSKKRVTGKRGDYGSLQLRRALEPALESKRDKVIETFDDALDRVARIVEG